MAEKRVISTVQEMTSLIGELKVDAPLPIQNALSSQMQIINFIQSPSLSDSVLSSLISNLEDSLDYCTNTIQRKCIRKQFSWMLQNYVFFLDARALLCIKKNKELSKTLFVNAGEMFSHNMKSLMLLTIQNFGMVAKVGADVVDVAGTNTMQAVAGMATVGINSAKTPVSTTTHEDGSVTIDEKGLDPHIAGHNVEMVKHTIDNINGNIGELSDRVSFHIDQWQEKVENTIINNVFSQEQIEKKNSFNSMVYDLLNQRKNTNEIRESFYETINNTIEKLDKYRQYIGKSIIISDMIERYLPELRMYLIEKEKGKSIGGMSKFPIIRAFRSPAVPPNEIATVDVLIEKSQKLTQIFSKTNALIDPSILCLNNTEQIYFDRYKEMYSKSELKREELERLRNQLNISIPRAKEIEDFF